MAEQEGSNITGTRKFGMEGQWETHIKAGRLDVSKCILGKEESALEPFQTWFQTLRQPKPVRTASSMNKAS